MHKHTVRAGAQLVQRLRTYNMTYSDAYVEWPQQRLADRREMIASMHRDVRTRVP